MPDSSFSFTAEVRPVCELGLSAARSAEPDEWEDVSCYVHEVELFRGRERFNDRFEAGDGVDQLRQPDRLGRSRRRPLGGRRSEVAPGPPDACRCRRAVGDPLAVPRLDRPVRTEI